MGRIPIADKEPFMRRFLRGRLIKTIGFMIFALGLALSASAFEIKPTSKEMQEEHTWFKAHSPEGKIHFTAVWSEGNRPALAEPGLDVLANHDPVVPNNRGGKPLKVDGKEYARGLYCHAISKIEVRLPSPGKSFSAVVGLDQNEDTAHGRGSVVFKVTVKGKVAFESEVTRYGTPARQVGVDLDAADGFTLEVGDAGDGIGWDQSDWADAKVTLANGQELRLGDMPLRDHRDEGGLLPISRKTELPFSFVCGGRSSDDLLAGWPKKASSRKLDAFRTEHTVRWMETKPGLEVRFVAVEYKDFPAVEWTVYFKNVGQANTPILENIQAFDTRFERTGEGEFVLHGNKGDWCAPQSYEPYTTPLVPGSSSRFRPDGGRPTNGPKGWPYFNLQMPGGGCLLAIGWPGEWACRFDRNGSNGLRVVAGQELTHLSLQAGEEIRTPLMALLFWKGVDTVRAQNLWRRWFLAHSIPRRHGQIPPAMTQMQCYRDFVKGGEKDLFDTVEEFQRAAIPVDLCWRDAGWYPCKSNWPNTGTWEIDTNRYPHGFRPFSDWVHQQGKKFIVWFEPERVGDGQSWLAKEQPNWILGGNLLNLGNPDAWQWLVGHIDAMLREQGIDWYRQDFNMDPLGNWRSNDTADRQGMTEMKHVMGYLAYWDELVRRSPGLMIDSCSSGGRRNDLETLRRALPLLRSDYQFGHEATMPNQGHTYGISSWIPYYGSGCYFTDTYSARSYIMPCSGYGGTNAETKRAYEECSRIAPFMLGDYYPLTPYSIQNGDWIAWQFDLPEQGRGEVQAFRREENNALVQVLHLSGLAPAGKYRITDFDGSAAREMTGRDLMQTGLSVEIKNKPGSAIIIYEKEK